MLASATLCNRVIARTQGCVYCRINRVATELGLAARMNELFESCALLNHSQGTMQHVKLFVENTAYCLLDANNLEQDSPHHCFEHGLPASTAAYALGHNTAYYLLHARLLR